MRVAILTVSDTAYEGLRKDESGLYISSAIEGKIFGAGAKVVEYLCVPDEVSKIKDALMKWSDQSSADLILTTGGTGLATRDVTPKATRSVLDKESFGITTALINAGLADTPYAMLSCAASGVRKKTLIINLPGSPRACKTSLKVIAKVVAHAVNLINDDFELIERSHENMKEVTSKSKVDVCDIVNRDRVSPFTMIAVDEAQNMILKQVNLMHTVNIHINQALGHTLAADIYASSPQPAFDASIKDGYAVISSDKTIEKLVIDSIVAGDIRTEKTIREGECIRVTTGAAIPKGADAVVQVEDTLLVPKDSNSPSANSVEHKILINDIANVQAGQDIRKVGSDVEINELLIPKGYVLNSSALGILASDGRTEIEVYSIPTIAVLSTGNEVQALSNVSLSEGKIWDSNKISIIALLQEQGFQAKDCGIIPDNPFETLHTLEKAIINHDVVITTGGVSMGELDIVAKVLELDLKAEIHFGRVNMKPGKPTKFATLMYKDRKKYVFALPGNPVSAAVTCHLFVLTALKAMVGYDNPLPTTIKAKCTFNVKRDDRPEYHRAILRWKSGIPYVVSTGGQRSSRLVSMLAANCLVYIPARTGDNNDIKNGDIVDVYIIGKL